MNPPVGLDDLQRAAWLKDKHFLQQLMDNTKVLHNLHCIACALKGSTAWKFNWIEASELHSWHSYLRR